MKNILAKSSSKFSAIFGIALIMFASNFYNTPAKADPAWRCRYTGSYEDGCYIPGVYIIRCTLGLSTSCSWVPIGELPQ